MKVGDLVRIKKESVYVEKGTIGIIVGGIQNRDVPNLILYEVQLPEGTASSTPFRRFSPDDLEVINESR
tara:strand:- start:848 stop:1054 length:207 start_codon:yes stop_codon:yes gene_type:complete